MHRKDRPAEAPSPLHVHSVFMWCLYRDTADTDDTADTADTDDTTDTDDTSVYPKHVLSYV